MNEIVGMYDILMFCFDILCYDVSVVEEVFGGIFVLNSCGNGWEKWYVFGNFIYLFYFVIFVGFLLLFVELYMLCN